MSDHIQYDLVVVHVLEFDFLAVIMVGNVNGPLHVEFSKLEDGTVVFPCSLFFAIKCGQP